MASFSSEASVGETYMSEKLKSTIEHIFSAVEYYALIGLLLYIGEEADAPILVVFGIVLSCILGIYIMLPVLQILPDSRPTGIKLLKVMTLYVFTTLVILALHIFVVSSISRAVASGIGV